MVEPKRIPGECDADVSVGRVIEDGFLEASQIFGGRLQLALWRDGRVAVPVVDGDGGDRPLCRLLGRQTGEFLARHQHGIDGIGIVCAIRGHGDRPLFGIARGRRRWSAVVRRLRDGDEREHP
jgi:hypothetical protein